MEPQHKKRSTFSGKMGFVLSAAGASVGLGNIWRFPYLAAKYGGGIFPLFYTYTGILGYHLMWADIAVFLLADLGMFVLDFRLLSTGRRGALWQQIAGLLVLWGLAFLFVWFTFRPPVLGLFLDPTTMTYGLPQ